MANLGVVPNNGSPNYRDGEWPMPASAPASEADSGNITPQWPSGKGSAGSDPQVGGNDGDLPDKLVG